METFRKVTKAASRGGCGLQYLLLLAGYVHQICSLLLAVLQGRLPVGHVVRKIIALPSEFLPAGLTVEARIGFEQIEGKCQAEQLPRKHLPEWVSH